MTELKHAHHYGTGLQFYNSVAMHTCDSGSLDRELQEIFYVSKTAMRSKSDVKPSLIWEGKGFTSQIPH